MYRRIIPSLYSSAFKRITTVRRNVAPCWYVATVKYCQNVPQPTQEWIQTAQSETESDLSFSELDPDEFGTLSKEGPAINEILEKSPEELEDREEFVVRDAEGKKQRRPMKFYYHLIKDLLEERKLVDAIDVLEVRMKEDGVKPDYHIYSLLINGCARVGYCKKAFKLYAQMKKTGVKRTPATYTGLFNACALSPDPEDGLMRLNNLRAKLQDAGVTLTLINYNAMMKAYARLNDAHSTFQVVDEILSKEYTLRADTFCFLLQACISDKENGMRHALLTWHKMRQKRVKPNLPLYNLFIRCIRDCQFGDEDELRAAIKRIVGESDAFLDSGIPSIQADQKLLESAGRNDEGSVDLDVRPSASSGKSEFTYEEIEMVENRPNLLAKEPYLGNIISVRSVKTPVDRLLLLGGYKNLLKEMEADGVKPDFKTFNQLLGILPSTESSEKYLMTEMEKYKVPITIDFCNTLIKQRALRFDYEGAKNVLSIIQSNYLQPDLITFGVMAMSCRHKGEAIELIRNMKAFSMRLNAEILGAMVHQACCRFNFDYVIFLMKLTQKYKISPNKEYMEHLEMLQKRAVESRHALRKKKPVYPAITKNPNFREDSLVFSDYFAQWKKEVDIFVPPHPYKQFAKPKDKTQQEGGEDGNAKRYEKNRSHDAKAKFSDDVDDSTFVPDDERTIRWHSTRTRNDRRTKSTFENIEQREESESMSADDDETVDDEKENFRTRKGKRRWNKGAYDNATTNRSNSFE